MSATNRKTGTGDGRTIKSAKAQMTIEFMLLLAVGIAAALVMILILGNRVQGIHSFAEFSSSRDMALSIQKEMIIAGQMDTGYSRKIFLPQNIDGREYTLVIANTTLVLTTPSYEHVFFIPLSQGNFTKGSWNTINNSPGIIMVN